MKKSGLIQVVVRCCAGVCLLGAACSSEDDDGGRAGTGGMGAVAGGAAGGRAGGSAAGGRASGGTAGGGNGGTGVAGSGGRPEGGIGGGGGDTGACDEEVTNGLVQRGLTEYCQAHECPETLEAARADALECSERQYSEEQTGCGLTVVSFHAEDSGRGFVFDGAALVGAYSFDDVVEPPCDTIGEVGGVYPPACPDADSCRICDQEDGAAGAGPFCDFGGGGAGGEGGR